MSFGSDRLKVHPTRAWDTEALLLPFIFSRTVFTSNALIHNQSTTITHYETMVVKNRSAMSA